MEKVRDYELKAFFTYIVEVLERLNIPYMVVGGFAAILYGEPRLTLDVDIVVDMEEEHVVPFVAAFPPPEYYASEDGIYDSLRRRYPFNVIQSTTGAKVDLVPLPHDALTRDAFQRRQRMNYDEAGHTAVFISAEDLILAKLHVFRETGSEKHLRDVRGIIVTQKDRLNLEFLQHRARAVGMVELLELIMKSNAQEMSA